MNIVYVIDADEQSRSDQTIILKTYGFFIKEFADSKEAIAACESAIDRVSVPALIIENVEGDIGGDSLLMYMHKRNVSRKIPVIIVSTNDTELNKAKAYDLDASDYIVKPIFVMSFLARINALIRQSKQNEVVTSQLQYKGIILDDSRHMVLSEGSVCNLTLKEYEILKYFLNHIGEVVKQEDLANEIWHEDITKTNATVRIHINTLRNKLGNQGESIKTMRNIGYKIE